MSYEAVPLAVRPALCGSRRDRVAYDPLSVIASISSAQAATTSQPTNHRKVTMANKVITKVGIATAAAWMAASAIVPSPAAADDMGCSAGDVCFYREFYPSAGSKIGIGRGEDNFWSRTNSPYKSVKSIYNNGVEDGYSDVYIDIVFLEDDGWWNHPQCLKRGERRGLYTNLTGTVIGIRWLPTGACG